MTRQPTVSDVFLTIAALAVAVTVATIVAVVVEQVTGTARWSMVTWYTVLIGVVVLGREMVPRSP